MTHAAPLLPVDAPATAASDGAKAVTRFGALTLDPNRVITFPDGLLGFAEYRRYVLAEVAGAEVFFKLLQSIDDPELAFVVLPLDRQDGPIAGADIDAACEALGLETADVAVLGIVTLRPGGEHVRFTVNLRAPLLIDTGRRVGRQHVLPSDAYPLRHPLPQPGADHAG